MPLVKHTFNNGHLKADADADITVDPAPSAASFTISSPVSAMRMIRSRRSVCSGSDLNLVLGTLRVSRRFYRGKVAPPKSKYGRRQLRLSAGLLRALWTLRKDTRANDDELVFTSENDS